ncbi:MAG: permease prefix domain 1-containing protein [Oscillospiraceae bacterium]|nr:permease prefix domain 1-containing protein [Oscillospiraceae bacterium]
MEDKIRRHVDELFAETAPTKKAIELKEEMIQNLNDKYNDLVSEGKTQEAAYNIVVAGIGDISALLSEVQEDAASAAPGLFETEYDRRKSAMFTAISVMMYILSPLPLIILAMLGNRDPARVGVPILFVMIAGATGLLVYNSMTKPRYHAGSGSMVAEFREWQADTKDRRALRRAISSALWAVVLTVYFIISFMTFAWHVTWIIFIIAGAIEAFINLFFTVKK